jgi:3-oxoacyl-[acyl-carrier protein] reductase
MANVQFDFADRTVIVTGAARGVGLGIADSFREAGAAVYGVDADEEALGAAAERNGMVGLVADVSSSKSVDELVERVIDETGRIDVIVNNAGILRDGMLWKLTDDDWEAVLSVHTGGTFRLSRAVVPHMRRQEGGRIVNVTSYTGLHGNLGQANYATAKAGIIGFTMTAAKELASFGITVNAISPNADTRMIASIPPERRAEIAATVPLGRFGDPSEIAPAVTFLASDEAAYITGVVLPVDGGIAI